MPVASDAKQILFMSELYYFWPKNPKPLMKKVFVLCIPFLFVFIQGFAQDKTPSGTGFSWQTGWSLSLKTGTLGLGGEVAKKIDDRFMVRLAGNFFGYNQNFNDVVFRLRLRSCSLSADWAPWQNIVHFSGGFVYNQNLLEVEINSIRPHSLLRIAPNAIDPYLGIGLGKVLPSGRLGFNVDLGLLYQGSPNVEYYIISDTNEPTASRAYITDGSVLGVYLYPVLSFQVSYRIN